MVVSNDIDVKGDISNMPFSTLLPSEVTNACGFDGGFINASSSSGESST